MSEQLPTHCASCGHVLDNHKITCSGDVVDAKCKICDCSGELFAE